MKPAIISEWRKLTTVRSTYILGGTILVISALLAFFAFGYKAQIFEMLDPGFLKKACMTTINFVALLASLIGILTVTHEYRYNTIMHTLTATNNRLYVLFGKVAVATLYAVAMTVLVVIVTIGFAVLGANMQGAHIAPQDLQLGDLFGRGLFFVWSYAMLGLFLAMIIRSQVAAIVTILIVPSIGEGLLSLVLRGNAKYLPFQSLSAVIGGQSSGTPALSTGSATISVLIYLSIVTVAAVVLLQQRDAN